MKRYHLSFRPKQLLAIPIILVGIYFLLIEKEQFRALYTILLGLSAFISPYVKQLHPASGSWRSCLVKIVFAYIIKAITIMGFIGLIQNKTESWQELSCTIVSWSVAGALFGSFVYLLDTKTHSGNSI